MKFTKYVLFVAIDLTVLTLFSKAAKASEILKPTLEWQRSTEALNKIATPATLGGGVGQALVLPLDNNQTVFDNGVFTPPENKNNVPVGNTWASWPQ